MNSILKQYRLRYGAVAALGMSVIHPGSARAQDDPAPPVQVESFDQLAVTTSIEEVFGGRYDLGAGIAELVRKRLSELGAASLAEGTEEGRVEGTIIYFGKESGRGEAAGVNVGGIRVGLGRRREVALVLLEARLIDVVSGQLVTFVNAEGKSDRGGWDVAASARRGGDLGSIDLSADEFRSSAIGEATHQAVDQLARSLADATDELGTFAAPEPEPEYEPDYEPAPGIPGGGFAMGGTMVGWAPYQFRGDEHFRYEVTQTEYGETSTGHYTLDLTPAGQDRVRMAVAGRLGDESYSSTVTTGAGPEGMQIGMNQFMALGPIGITLLNPASWMMLAGHELNIGDGWSYSSDGESFSVKVESSCSHGGESGSLVVFRENDAVTMESCLAQGVALPLRMLMADESSRIELTLTEYRE